MRTKLGRVAALTVLGVAAVVAFATAAAASPPAPDDSTTTTTTEAPVTSTDAPLVADMPSVPPLRGSSQQVTETIPPPPTTTTLPPTALPSNSGEGRRVVYSKSRQRVWAVEDDGSVAKTHLVSGRRTWNQPTPNNQNNHFEPQFKYYSDPPAYYRVASRSMYTCNIKNPAICWRYMVRFTKGPDGDNIGLHEIPKNNGVPVQSVSQLGTPLSGGCVRQGTNDAVFMWNWAGIGTKVVVLG